MSAETRGEAVGVGPFAFFEVRVAAIRDLGPSFRRITFRGDGLVDFADPGWDQRIKLVFPLPDHGLTTMPRTRDWYGDWRLLPAEQRPPFRTYTTRAVRRDPHELDVDIVLHRPLLGPASHWAATARPGDELLILGPHVGHEGVHGGIDFVPPERTDRLLLAGDETAAPAIAVILEQLPRDARGTAIVELPSARDIGYLPAHPGVQVHAVIREHRDHGEALVHAVQQAAARLSAGTAPATEFDEIDVDREILWEVPRNERGGAALDISPIYAWLAGESAAITTLRRHLVRDRGIDRRSVAFMGYWRIGRSEV
jgi:NADPH-dependent ferric siderophore reductase